MADLTPVIEVALTLALAILLRYFIPAMRERLSADKQAELYKWVQIAVYAAEKLYGSGTGSTKYKYAKELLESRGFTFDEETLKALINAEIKRMENEESVVVVGDVTVSN